MTVMGALKAIGRALSGKRASTFEAFQGPSGQWFVRERAANGEVMNLSEAYSARAGAIRAAKRRAANMVGAKSKVIPLPKVA